MTKSRLPARFDSSLVRHIAAGSFNTALSFAIYVGAVQSGLHYTIANAIAWAVSLIIAFLLASTYVFRKPIEYARFPPFVLSNIASLILSTAMLFMLVNAFAVSPLIASAIVIPIVVVVNFCAARYLVFG